MKAEQTFILQNIGDLYFILPGKAKDFLTPDRMLTTNETGAYLWKQLQTEISQEELTASFQSFYQIDEATATEDVSSFLQALQKIGAL